MIAYVVVSGDIVHGSSPRAVVLDPSALPDAVIEADDFHRRCYGGEPRPLTLDAFVAPEPGKRKAATRNVTVYAFEVTPSCAQCGDPADGHYHRIEVQ